MSQAHPWRRLAPLALIALLAASCGDNDKSAGTTAALPPPPETTPAVAPPSGGSGGPPRKNRLLMGTRDLYPLLGASLQRYAPTQVTGKSSRVIALAGPTSFWAGSSRSKRILVTIRLKGGKAPKLRVGQKIDFVGLMVPTASADAQRLGVNDDPGQKVLNTEGVYVDVSVADLHLRR